MATHDYDQGGNPQRRAGANAVGGLVRRIWQPADGDLLIPTGVSFARVIGVGASGSSALDAQNSSFRPGGNGAYARSRLAVRGGETLSVRSPRAARAPAELRRGDQLLFSAAGGVSNANSSSNGVDAIATACVADFALSSPSEEVGCRFSIGATGTSRYAGDLPYGSTRATLDDSQARAGLFSPGILVLDLFSGDPGAA